MKRGVLAIGVSPDGHSVGILTKDFQVLVHDKISEVTFELAPLTADFLGPGGVSLSTMVTSRSSSELRPSERFSLYVSNNCSSLYVISDSERLVVTWQESHEQTRAQKAARERVPRED